VGNGCIPNATHQPRVVEDDPTRSARPSERRHAGLASGLGVTARPHRLDAGNVALDDLVLDGEDVAEQPIVALAPDSNSIFKPSIRTYQSRERARFAIGVLRWSNLIMAHVSCQLREGAL
jgi:hypothetical protein